MDAAETDALLRSLLPLVGDLGGKVLIGALDPDAARAGQAMEGRMNLALETAGAEFGFGELRGEPEKAAVACAAAGIAGFAVCAPAGEGRSQEEIEDALSAILALGLPTALYQLPQVTKNEISPATFARLAARWPNLYLLKDTSGLDHIALAGIERAGVFFVRGMEGDFSRWISRSGTCEGAEAERRYDGLLLSSANVFAAELADTIRLARSGEEEKAASLSGRISRVVNPVLAEAAGLPYGNAFSNANRALDWVMAYGQASGRVSASSDEQRTIAPRTHSGEKLPASLIEFAAAALAREGFEPPRYEGT
ncbi:MAG TPA: hypothetical protein DIT55_04830 [Spirochaetaceae bacterium]|nr:hypothetical protein [Spirochaetaceae bacterium]